VAFFKKARDPLFFGEPGALLDLLRVLVGGDGPVDGGGIGLAWASTLASDVGGSTDCDEAARDGIATLGGGGGLGEDDDPCRMASLAVLPKAAGPCLVKAFALSGFLFKAPFKAGPPLTAGLPALDDEAGACSDLGACAVGAAGLALPVLAACVGTTPGGSLGSVGGATVAATAVVATADSVDRAGTAFAVGVGLESLEPSGAVSTSVAMPQSAALLLSSALKTAAAETRVGTGRGAGKGGGGGGGGGEEGSVSRGEAWTASKTSEAGFMCCRSGGGK